MSDRRGPADPMTELGTMAASLHELFTEYQKAGFSRREALELVKEQVRAAVMQAPPAS